MKIEGKKLTPEIQELFSEHGVLLGVWVPGNGTIIAHYDGFMLTFTPKYELFEFDED